MANLRKLFKFKGEFSAFVKRNPSRYRTKSNHKAIGLLIKYQLSNSNVIAFILVHYCCVRLNQSLTNFLLRGFSFCLELKSKAQVKLEADMKSLK